jgi:alpha-L-fucosidase
MDIFYNSIGRNATLLLNFPIMPNGLIHEYDEKVVLEFAQAIKKAFAVNLAKGSKAEASNVRGNDQRFDADKAVDQNFETYWTTDDNVTMASVTMNFKKSVSFNRILIQEYIRLGQRVKSFKVESFTNGVWMGIAKETTIGYKRILRFNTVQAVKIRLTITDSKSCPLISNIEIYNAPQILAPPSIVREQSGDVIIIPADFESQLYYTLDGSNPTIKSNKYTEPIKTDDGKMVVKCMAYDPVTKNNSQVSEEKFDIARKHWKIIGIEDKNAYNILDGNISSQWYQDSNQKMPVDLVIDFGKVEYVSGFKYLPDQNWWAGGIVTNYRFFVSHNGQDWRLIDEGEFANIKNNPLWQSKLFTPVKARYIKLQALHNTQNDSAVGYAEIDVITE